MARGLSILPDEPMVERAAYENTQSRGRLYPGDADVQQVDATGVQGGEQSMGYDSGATYESETTDLLQAMPVQQSVADWTAASVTVLVQP